MLDGEDGRRSARPPLRLGRPWSSCLSFRPPARALGSVDAQLGKLGTAPRLLVLASTTLTRLAAPRSGGAQPHPSAPRRLPHSPMKATRPQQRSWASLGTERCSRYHRIHANRNPDPRRVGGEGKAQRTLDLTPGPERRPGTLHSWGGAALWLHLPLGGHRPGLSCSGPSCPPPAPACSAAAAAGPAHPSPGQPGSHPCTW